MRWQSSGGFGGVRRDRIVNINLNIRFMKKLIYLLIVSFSLFSAGKAHAQFRSVPAVVTDSFKAKYPSATGVSWSDKLFAGSFQATFTPVKESYVARFGNKGE